MLGLIWCLVAVPRLCAGLGDELVSAHLEKMGGLARIQGIAVLRVEGKTTVQGQTVDVRMWAGRPNLLRVESRRGNERFVQVYDGNHPAWQRHTGLGDGAPAPMSEADAREFVRQSDFDGPLVGYAAKGFSVDYAGEDKIEGRSAWKLLVMNKSNELLFFWLDQESGLLVKRLEYRTIRGRRVGIETFYRDYRPVNGVPQPYRVETRLAGRVLNATVIDKMEANPLLPPGTFDYPPELAEAATAKSAENGVAASRKPADDPADSIFQ